MLEQKLKRLILVNLNFTKITRKLIVLKIGLSKFCALRPSVHYSWMSRDAVYVYDSSQCQVNGACPPSADNNVTYKYLMQSLFAQPMANSARFIDVLTDLDQDRISTWKNIHEAHEVPLEDTVQYKQWITTDRTNLQDISSSFQDFMEMLADKSDKLTSHHFIAKHQSSYLAQWTENIHQNEAVFLLDFAENLFSDPRCFTDGAASQYKNFKNYSNLVHHQEDSQLSGTSLPPATARMPVLA